MAEEKIAENNNSEKGNPRQIGDKTSRLGSGVRNTANGVKALGNKASSLGNGAANDAIDSGSNGASDGVNMLDDAASDAISKSVDGIKNAKDAAKGAVNTAKSVKNAPQNIKNTAKRIKEAPKEAAKAAKNTARTVKNTIRATKLAVKTGIKAAKATAKLAKLAIKFLITLIQAIINLIITIVVTCWWLILIIITCALLFSFLNGVQERGDKVNDGESIVEYNEVIVTDDDSLDQTSISSGNKIVNAFYTLFAEKSLWVMSDGKVYTANPDRTKEASVKTDKNLLQLEPIQYNSEEYLDKYQNPDEDFNPNSKKEQMLDKYYRESAFYINPDQLYTLDKYLFNQKFRFPELLIQPVPYEENTGEDKEEYPLILKDLVDENGKIAVKSTAFKKGQDTITENEPVSVPAGAGSASQTTTTITTDLYYTKDTNAEKVTGIWDYGFGNIVSYSKYYEAKESIGQISTFEVWNPDKENEDGTIGGVDLYSADKYNALPEATRKKLANDFTKELGIDKVWDADYDSSYSYMITYAITPAGTITNKIDFSWQDTGITATKHEQQTITKIKKVKTTEMKETKLLQPGESVLVIVSVDVNGVETKKMISNDANISRRISYPYTYYKDTEVAITLNATIEGTVYSCEPRYADDEVNLTHITGTKYFKDYLTSLECYVPRTVQGKFNFEDIKKRTGKNNEELLKLLERESFGKTTSSYSTSLFNDEGKYIGIGSYQIIGEIGADEPGAVNPGVIAASDGLGNKSWGMPQFPKGSLDSFIKWLQENHLDFYNTYFKNKATGSTAFDEAWKRAGEEVKEEFTVYQFEFAYPHDMMSFLNLCEKDSILKNIDFTSNFYVQEAVYSMACVGPSAFFRVAQKANLSVNDTPEQIITKLANSFVDNARSCVYPGYTQAAYNNIKQGIYNRWSPKSTASNNQIAQMLEAMKENPEIGGFEYDDENQCFITTGSGIRTYSTNGGSFIGRLMNSLSEFFDDVDSFYAKLIEEEYKSPLAEDAKCYEKKSYRVSNKDIDWILATLIANIQGDGKISDYTGIVNDDYFTLMYEGLFTNQLTASDANRTSLGIYFRNGYSTPLKMDENTEILKKYDASNNPIIIVNTTNKNEVYAVDDGVIIKTGNDLEYGGRYIIIQHKSCISIYGNISNVKYKKGDRVGKGKLIAISGSKFYFALKTKLYGNYLNPTDIFSTYDLTGLVVPANGMKIPLILQTSYPNDYFYDGTSILRAGCGFTSMAMIVSYMTGTNVSPVEIKDKFQYSYYTSVGMSWGLPSAVAKYYKLGNVTQTTDPGKVMKALSNGQPVACSQAPGIFTKAGHIIVLRGTDGNGGVYVNDPNDNTKNKNFVNRVFNMATEVHVTAKNYWIFEKPDESIISSYETKTEEKIEEENKDK